MFIYFKPIILQKNLFHANISCEIKKWYYVSSSQQRTMKIEQSIFLAPCLNCILLIRSYMISFLRPIGHPRLSFAIAGVIAKNLIYIGLRGLRLIFFSSLPTKFNFPNFLFLFLLTQTLSYTSTTITFLRCKYQYVQNCSDILGNLPA